MHLFKCIFYSKRYVVEVENRCIVEVKFIQFTFVKFFKKKNKNTTKRDKYSLKLNNVFDLLLYS